MAPNVARSAPVNEFQDPCEPMNAEQLPLGNVVQNAFGSAGEKFLRGIAEAVGAAGKVTDDLAADLGVDPGQFSRAMHSKGTHFSVKWLPAILYRDRARIVIRHLAHLCGGEFVERPRLKPEEKLALLEKTRRDAGLVGEAVIRQAYGEDMP